MGKSTNKRPELRVRIDGDLHQWLREECEERAVGATFLVNKALRMLRADTAVRRVNERSEQFVNS